ncbi:type IV secretory system conjugative DNA transfer family protein [Lewinella sp. LCG006]|uniref:type IV secretory system conjugative DNA transfer family protein n=1 Tax=Lewinella sp. LCG006 TaxID=3231911 RepID=UPI0034603910
MKDKNERSRNRMDRKIPDYESNEEGNGSENQEPLSINELYQRMQGEDSSRPTPSGGITDWSNRITDLDTPLLRFNIEGNLTYDLENLWRLRDAVRGVQIFGGIGSGKSSGSGRTLALTFLKSGFGGIVLTGKIDEVNEWKRYAFLTGRLDDLVIFEAGKDFSFNPLQYENTRNKDKQAETLNLVNLIMSIYEMGQSFSGGGGANSERFWDNALRRCISNVIDLLKLAEEEISIFNMRKLLIALLSGQEAQDYVQLQRSLSDKHLSEEQQTENRTRIAAWVNHNYCLTCLTKAYRRKKSDEEQELYGFVQDYFLITYPRIADKTKAIVEESFFGLVEPFMRGILRKHFTEGLSQRLRPEQTYTAGKIIIINFPVKEYLIAGVYAQAIYKKLWQEAIERRDVKEHPLPVFMWIDEAQYFLNEHDARFQTTARSSRACTVLITQNISNYYAAIGGTNPKDKVNSLLGNLATKIFHGNNDSVTNNWAAETIGKTFRTSTSTNTNAESVSGSTTMSESLHYQIEPQQFTILKGGGEENRCQVEGIITVAGKLWSNGKNFIKTEFDQNFKI